MLGTTHSLIGLTTVAVVNGVYPFIQPHIIEKLPTGPFFCAVAAMVGALVPDLDAENSTIEQEMGLAGQLLSDTLKIFGVKHRGATHFGIAGLLVMAFALFIGYKAGFVDVGFAFGLGYISHILADGCTKSGVPLFAPFKKDCVRILPRLLLVRTGSAAERLLALGITLSLFFVLPNLMIPELEKFVRKVMSGGWTL
jgi:inner membrane protein